MEGYQLGVNLILAAFPEHVDELKRDIIITLKWDMEAKNETNTF